MKKALLIMLLLSVAVFGKCQLIPEAELSTTLCDSYADANEYINAGCCYMQVEEWGNCVFYILKGAHYNEILWDLNQGSWDAGTKAKQYYNPEFFVSSGLGSETGVCLNGYGDTALTAEIHQYYEWIQFYGYGGEDVPPFDMGDKIDALDAKLHPPEVIATPTPVPTSAPVVTPVPTAPPAPEETDNTGVLLVVAVLILGVVAFFIFKRKGSAAPVVAIPEPSTSEPKREGYLYKAAEKAKESHKKEEKKHHKKPKHKKKGK